MTVPSLRRCGETRVELVALTPSALDVRRGYPEVGRPCARSDGSVYVGRGKGRKRRTGIKHDRKFLRRCTQADWTCPEQIVLIVVQSLSLALLAHAASTGRGAGRGVRPSRFGLLESFAELLPSVTKVGGDGRLVLAANLRKASSRGRRKGWESGTYAGARWS